MSKKTEEKMIPCKVKRGKSIAVGYMPGASVNGVPMIEHDEAGEPSRYVLEGGDTASLPDAFFRRHVSHLELLGTTVDEFLEREESLGAREAALSARETELEAWKAELESQAEKTKSKKK